jgi:hypothetical protein
LEVEQPDEDFNFNPIQLNDEQLKLINSDFVEAAKGFLITNQ